MTYYSIIVPYYYQCRFFGPAQAVSVNSNLEFLPLTCYVAVSAIGNSAALVSGFLTGFFHYRVKDSGNAPIAIPRDNAKKIARFVVKARIVTRWYFVKEIPAPLAAIDNV